MNELIIPSINRAIVLITNKCNLACPYCFECLQPKRMSLDMAKDILSFLHSDSDSAGFTFFGGEPCLEWDKVICPMVEYANSLDKKTRFSMTTNGTLLNKERVDYLIENNISFLLSMDGSPDTQNINRPLKNGKGSYNLLENVLPYIIERRPMQQVRGTVSGNSVANLFNDIMWFEQLGVKRLVLLPNLLEEWSEELKSIFTEQIMQYEEYIIKFFRDGIKPLLFQEYETSFWRVALSIKTSERRVNKQCFAKNQCGFGIHGSASIDTDGNLYGCHRTDMNPDSIWCIGNIYDGVDANKVKALMSLYESTNVGNSRCSSCPLDNICNGGCASNNWSASGDVNIVPELFCFWTRTLADSAYRVCQILGKENNSLFANVFRMQQGGKLWTNS